jgi:hypothetical protein
MSRSIILICLLGVTRIAIAQDTLYISGTMYLGTFDKVDSAAEIIEFLEFQSDRRFIVPFSSVTKEKPQPSDAEKYFVSFDQIDGGPVRTSPFSAPSRYIYDPLVIGLDLLSTVLVSQYRVPDNPTIGAYIGYTWKEKYAGELHYRRGLNLPERETITGFTDGSYAQAIRESFGASLMVFPAGQIKFAPMVGFMYRLNTGIYYHQVSEDSYSINPETGIRDVFQNYSSTFEKRNVGFSDVGFVLGYRINFSRNLNLEVRLPLYSSNGSNKMYSSETYSNFDSDTYQLVYSYEGEGYREWEAQLKFFFIYRFGAVAKL